VAKAVNELNNKNLGNRWVTLCPAELDDLRID
jgi:hypothetical protein